MGTYFAVNFVYWWSGKKI